MIRRALLVAALLSASSFAAGTAFAGDVKAAPNGDRSICVGTASGPNSFDGICVWVPTN